MKLGTAYGDGFVGVNGSTGKNYVRGDENTVGGIRLAADIGDSLPRVERNIAGVWTLQGTFPGLDDVTLEFLTYFLGE